MPAPAKEVPGPQALAIVESDVVITFSSVGKPFTAGTRSTTLSFSVISVGAGHDKAISFDGRPQKRVYTFRDGDSGRCQVGEVSDLH